MLFHLSTLPLVMFLGAIVCTAASRYEDDDGLPLAALTDQANDHQQIVYDVDNGVNANFFCNPSILNRLWDSGVQRHLNHYPYDGCDGGHAVSRYIISLDPRNPKIRNVQITGFNETTGLLTVSSYEYRKNAGPWPPANKCAFPNGKTLWNDATAGANLGQQLAKFAGVSLPAGFPPDGWTNYQSISYPNSEIEQQCKRSLEALQCLPNSDGSYVVPSSVKHDPPFDLCVRVATGGNNVWKTCFPVGINAATGGAGATC